MIPGGVYSLRRHQPQNKIMSIYRVKWKESNSSWLCELSTGLKAKQVWAGLPALHCLAGNTELPRCVERGLLKGSELQTSMECESEPEGHLRKGITVKTGASGKKVLKAIEERHPTVAGTLGNVSQTSAEKTSKQKRAV